MQNRFDQWPCSSRDQFQNDHYKQKLYQQLFAWAEEWGHDSVHMTLPSDWLKHGQPSSLGRIKLLFTNDNSIGIHVRYTQDGMDVSLDYELKLA